MKETADTPPPPVSTAQNTKNRKQRAPQMLTQHSLKKETQTSYSPLSNQEFRN
jgi:hypothetical protein